MIKIVTFYVLLELLKLLFKTILKNRITLQ